MKLLPIILLFQSTQATFAQHFARDIDSTIVLTTIEMDQESSARFTSIYDKALAMKFNTRIDSLTYDYGFFDATLCLADSSFSLNERYFKAGDSIPVYLYRNGNPVNVKSEYDFFLVWYSKNVTHYTTLQPMLDEYSMLKSRQELPYDSVQIMSVGCIVNPVKEAAFEGIRTNRIKQTWQIQLFVNRKDNTLKVSFQSPPKKPKFKVHYYNAVWDW